MPHLSLPFVFYFVLFFCLFALRESSKNLMLCVCGLYQTIKERRKEVKRDRKQKKRKENQHRQPSLPHSTETQHSSRTRRTECPNLICRFTNAHSRHKRTHDRGDGADGLNLSGEDEEEYSGEDLHGSLGDASPNSEGGYVTTSLNSVANSINTPPTSHGSMGSSNSNHMTSSQPHYNSLQTLSMPMSITTPQQMNTAVMM